ncbi:3-dehydroquinate synthase [Bacteroidota bacterium]
MRTLHLHIDDHITSILIGRKMISRLNTLNEANMILLIDENVFNFHKDLFKGKRYVVIPEGEAHKTLDYLTEIFRKLVAMEADRTSFLVGIGGGLVTDVAGFVASTYMRGIRFGFISSTLLGQVDASIGGKNGVNLDGFKNMIGVIRQPEFVWCDLDLLQTLPESELRSGFSEVIKYGAISDRALFESLESRYTEVLNLEENFTEEIVARSAAIKVEIVSSDVFEQGERKHLNFGHTMGHAIEKLTGMLHGEAVAIGMVLAASLSVNLGFLKASEAERLERLIQLSGLPTKTSISPEQVFETLHKDKKRTGDHIHFVLIKELGEAFVHPLKLDELKTAINDLY